jgi:hypothetical protein
MTYEQVKKPSSSFVPVQKKVSGFAPPASRVQAKDVTAGEQEQIALGSTPATDANWLMKHPLLKGNGFLQRVVAPASESESKEREEETVQRQEAGKETATPHSRTVQAKLTIGEPGDKYEQEADRVASLVVKQINSPEAASSSQGQSVQRMEEPVEELQRQPSISDLQRSPLSPEVQREAMPAESELQAKSILQPREAEEGGEASTDLDSAINSARGGGQPLDAGLQRSMGQAMGADFSRVRVHTDAQSDQLNQSIQAKAFTTGQDVFFRQGAYEPGSRGGQELIAHELTHVVQQNGGYVRRQTLQRSIRTRDGHNYSSRDEKLPEGIRSNCNLKKLRKSKSTWLAQSEADVIARGKGNLTPLLSPHRHLIGEHHDQSRFVEALTMWGWGADRMAESFQRSDEVTDEITESNKKQKIWFFFQGPYYGMKELENLHAYTLQHVGFLREHLSLQAQAEQTLGLHAKGVYRAILGFGSIPQKKQEFYANEQKLDELRTRSWSAWKDCCHAMLINYKKACEAVENTPRPRGESGQAKLHDLATSMMGHWDRLDSVMRQITSRPYWKTSSWPNTTTYLQQRSTVINQFITELAKVSLESRERKIVDSSWSATKTGGSSLVEVSKIREIYMKKNISQLERPAIVQIGQAHVNNMRGQIPNTKFHNSYAEFKADTEGTNL